MHKLQQIVPAYITDTTATTIGPSIPKNKKAKVSNLSSATHFAVCRAVNLGLLLTDQSQKKMLETWTEIEKNIDLMLDSIHSQT